MRAGRRGAVSGRRGPRRWGSGATRVVPRVFDARPVRGGRFGVQRCAAAQGRGAAAGAWRCGRGGRGSARAVRGGAGAGLVPGARGGGPRALAGAGDLPAQRGGAAGRAAVHVLRGAADGERDAGRAPRAGARLQGSDPALQDDAGLPRAAEGRLGHARATGGARGRARAGAALEARDRGVRARRVQPQVPRVGVPLRRRLGADDGANRVLDRYCRGVRDVLERVHRDGVVDLPAALGSRLDLPRLPGDAALPAVRDQPLQPRGRARLPRGHRGPERDGAVRAAVDV